MEKGTKMKLTKLLVASHNQGKVRELRELLAPYGIETVSATEFNLPEPEETESTFVGNARLKAVAAATASGLPALADDSGLCIDALDGQPGIYSARWGGEEKDFVKATARIKAEIEAKGLNPQNQPAHFICVLSLAQPDGSSVEFEGRIDGTLTFPARGDKGFGYDPIFVPHHDTKTFAEMEQLEKNQRNHRADAFQKFVEWLKAKNFAL